MIDKITRELLNIDVLLSDLRIRTVQGRFFFDKFSCFTSSDNKKLQKEYDLLFSLNDFFRENNELYIKVIDYLEHIEDISFLENKGDAHKLIIEDFFLIKKFLYFFLKINDILEKFTIKKISFDRNELHKVWKILSPDGKDEYYFHFYSEYNEKLRELREEKRQILIEGEKSKKKFLEKLNEKYNIKLSTDKISLSNYFEKDKIEKLLSSGDFIVLDKNFANTMLGVCYDESILNIEKDIHLIDEKIEKIEDEIAIELTKKILEYKSQLIQANNYIGEIDFIFCRIDYLRRYNCCKPEIISDGIFIEEGRFIFFEKFLLKKGLSYQPLTVDIENNVNIIIGMNMGGKTIFLKTLGFLAAHLNYGLPVPAVSIKMPIFDNIFFSTEDYHVDKTDLSSFGYELYRLNEAMNLKGRNLFILDEPAKGTNPYEAVALNKSFIKYFLENDIYALISSHFNLYMKSEFISYFNMSYLKDDFFEHIKNLDELEFSQKLQILQNSIVYKPIEIGEIEVVPDQAINIANFLGINPKIIDNARKFLNEVKDGNI